MKMQMMTARMAIHRAGPNDSWRADVLGLVAAGKRLTAPAEGRPQTAPDRQAPVLKQIASIDLPGHVGKRFDYLAVHYTSGTIL